MLKAGIRQKKKEGVSLRSIGRALGYKQPTVLSHMANGRTRIPIKRTQEIAFAVGLDPAKFLAASIKQREPATGDLLTPVRSTSAQTNEDSFVTELAIIGQRPLAMLTDEQRAVLREVVADPSPRRRWLSLPELPTVVEIRRRFPEISTRGLSPEERRRLNDALDH